MVEAYDTRQGLLVKQIRAELNRLKMQAVLKYGEEKAIKWFPHA